MSKDSTHLERIGNSVSRIREYRKMKQEELATLADIRVATVSEIESGKSNFQINTLFKIASALNCYINISMTPVD